MKFSYKQSRRGLSLIEVLVATSIIAIAMYGMMLAFTAQQAANAATRERQLIKTLHYQLVKEILNAERNPWDTQPTGNWTDSSFSGPIDITHPALGSGKMLSYSDRVYSIYGVGAPYILESVVAWKSPTGSDQSHTIRVYFLR